MIKRSEGYVIDANRNKVHIGIQLNTKEEIGVGGEIREIERVIRMELDVDQTNQRTNNLMR